MPTVLSLDPGVTTGYVIANLQGRRISIEVGQAEWTLMQVFERLREVCINRGSHIVYETFEYRNASRRGLNLTPVKIIGVIELMQEWFPSRGFYPQTAAQGKGFYSDDKLKELGVYVKGKPHGRDATRHLLHWLNFGYGSLLFKLEGATIKLV